MPSQNIQNLPKDNRAEGRIQDSAHPKFLYPHLETLLTQALSKFLNRKMILFLYLSLSLCLTSVPSTTTAPSPPQIEEKSEIRWVQAKGRCDVIRSFRNCPSTYRAIPVPLKKTVFFLYKIVLFKCMPDSL